jgi:hypothetical protein
MIACEHPYTLPSASGVSWSSVSNCTARPVTRGRSNSPKLERRRNCAENGKQFSNAMSRGTQLKEANYECRR